MGKKDNTFPIRRSQLLTPYGVGALFINPAGVSLMCAGLDDWFKNVDKNVNEYEYKIIDEWRLNKKLRVDHLRLPPDYRYLQRGRKEIPNIGITIPFLRFPTWHACSSCRAMKKLPNFSQADDMCCPKCGKWSLRQIPIVVICSHGHIQDFPWNEWVHASLFPECKGENLKLISGRGIGRYTVECQDCGKKRNLAQVAGFANSNTRETHLSKHLAATEQDIYLCQGHRPWLEAGKCEGEAQEDCKEHVRATFTTSSNVYFPQIISSIYIPNKDRQNNKLLQILREERMLVRIESYKEDMPCHNKIAKRLLEKQQAAFLGYTDEDITKALDMAFPNEETKEQATLQESTETINQGFRPQEYDIFQSPIHDENLDIYHTKLEDYKKYADPFPKFFSKVALLNKLKETRVLYGFTRLNYFRDDTSKRKLAALRSGTKERWLPAIEVFGEGIFLELNQKTLNEWQQLPEVSNRAQQIKGSKNNAGFIMLHTLAHLLINQLTFSAGYSAASLRERIYYSTEENMAGLLIYTASGDSEGSMGGLVRLGQAEYLPRIINEAFEKARWCSADPVCMESEGQGVNKLNLAACHNCALLPETSCEEFNSYLDRALVIGKPDDEKLGFFADWRFN